MTLLAGVLGGPEILHRRCDGAGIVVERVGDELVRAIELGLDEMLGTETDVARDAIYAGVRPALVGDELGVHRAMTDLAAKLVRFGVVIGLVAAERAQQDEPERA